jgi:endonuclease/exonuclease/phosphatase family metal-dependent hydrolase
MRTKTKTCRASLTHRPAAKTAREAGLISLALAAVCLLPALTHAGTSESNGNTADLDTMTVNLYVGAGTERVLALDPADPGYLSNLVFTVTGIYYEIAASEPGLRLQQVADTIAARLPDLVAVQEASLIRLQSPGDLISGGSIPATNIVFDYLAILTDALAARGASYRVASVREELDVELPMFNLSTGTFDDARLTDRDAILVRADLPPNHLRIRHTDSGTFSHVLQIPSIGLTVKRGWCSADVSLFGRDFRYICTHLEEETSPTLQNQQALELIDGPAHTQLPVLLCGDFNSDPLHRDGSFAYDTLVGENLRDAWAARHPASPAGGLTWGHDETLSDPSALFDRRIDLILFSTGDFTPSAAEVLDMATNQALPPLWASDHAAVFARLRFHGSSAPAHERREHDARD